MDRKHVLLQAAQLLLHRVRAHQRPLQPNSLLQQPRKPPSLTHQGIAHFGSDKKAASKHFATCSWLLSKLIRVRPHPLTQECKAIKKLGSNELHGDHLAFLKALVAAQTEVCTYEVLKATGKVALVPKVLAEVTARYTEAARLLDKPAVKKVVGSSENKSFAQFNKLYWGCLTHFAQFRHLAQQAGASGEGKEAGDALAHAQLACELHDACKKFVAKMPTRLHKDYADISKEYTVEIQPATTTS